MAIAAPEPSQARPAPGRWRRVAATLLWFVLLGPPIGAVIFVTGMAAAIGFDTGSARDAGAVLLVSLIYGVPFSYWMGLPSAVVAGAVVAAWRLWRGSLSAAGALAIGAAVGLGTVMAANSADKAATAASLIASCIVATLACWRLSGGAGRCRTRPPADQ